MQKNYFQSLNIIWLAMSLAPFLILIVFTIIKDGMGKPELKGLFDYIAAGIALMGAFMSQVIYTLFLKQGSEVNLKRKFEIYRIAQVLKGAILEGSSIFCAIAYLLTQSTWLFAFPVLILTIMFIQRPTQEKFCQEMNVSESELETN